MKYCDQFQYQSIDLCDDKEDLDSNTDIVKKLYISEHHRLDQKSMQKLNESEYIEEDK
jgi:hypothetical protein